MKVKLERESGVLLPTFKMSRDKDDFKNISGSSRFCPPLLLHRPQVPPYWGQTTSSIKPQTSSWAGAPPPPLITKKYSDVKIQLDLRFIKNFLCGKYSKLRWLGNDDIGEAEMEGHQHCCPNVALMCPCCPIVNFKHSAHCSANSLCRHDLSSQRKHNYT